jgi:ferredoxin
MPIVKFVNEKKEIEVATGTNLRAEAVKAGINLNCAISGVSEGIDKAVSSITKYTNCSFLSMGVVRGMCGTCRVRIMKGMENTNSLTTREKMKFKYMPLPDPIPCLAYLGNEDSMRLACMTEVNGDIEVESCPPLNVFGENFFS